MTNSGTTSITLEEIKAVLASLKQQRDTIKDCYNSDIKKVLESSDACLKVSGLDTSAINSSISTTFNKVIEYLNGLINVLENDVIKNYSDVSTSLRQMFGSDFATKLSELLDIK